MAAEEPIDTAALVRSVQEEVARRRAAGEYPPELLARLRAELGDDDEAPEPPEALAVVESARPLRSDRPLGRAIVTGKRAVRRLLAWYVAPIAQEQTRFNLAILRELRLIEERLHRVETPLAVASPAGDLARGARLAAVLRLVDATGEIAVAGDLAIAEGLRDAGRVVVGGAGTDPIRLLSTRGTATVDAVVLAGILPMLSPAELLEVLPAAWGALRPNGTLVVDGPRPPDRALDPGIVDPTFVRWLHAQTVASLCERAGFATPRVEDAADAAWPWELHVTRRSS